jgi:uncharacterized protein
MYIEIKEIESEGLVVDRLLNEPSLPLEGSEVVALEPVHLLGTLMKEEEGISFAGHLETVATLSCSRCLEAYRQPLRQNFDLLYVTGQEAPEGGEARMNEDRVTLTPFDGHRIELDPLVAEQVYLGLPLKPLCRDDCRGLCPRCGTNLNQSTCACQEERAEDPRLLVLKKLL